MGKSKGKHRLDKYYRLAKEHGYRSRASWKLVQIDSKHDFLRSSRAVLDLCAAPGGWMQVAVERMPVGSLILGIDLVRIAPIRGAVSLEQDITRPECKARIKKVMSENGVSAFDCVLHDGSPNIGGAWAQEAVSQNSLVIDAVRLATQFLAPKGVFVTKIFRSQDYSSVLYCLNQLFEKVDVDKPAASRSSSAEIFLIGSRYKAPAKIDPRLLDVKHLFQGSVEPQKQVIDVLRGTKQKRHRDGYEDGVSIIRKVSSAADFIWSENPLEVLGSVTSVTFEDETSRPIKEHALTTEEVKMLCDDLRVLGKQDFKHLLKWRMNIRKALSSSQKKFAKTEVATSMDGEERSDGDEDDKLLNEMEELTTAIDRKKKRAKKLLAKRREKEKGRKATGMQIDALEDGYVDHELFSLSSIKGKKDLVAVDAAEDKLSDLSGSDNEESEDQSSSDIDSEEEQRRYDEKIEDFLDQAYEQFVSKREGSTKQRKRAKRAHSDELLEGDDNDVFHSDDDLDEDQVDEDKNPLVVPFDEEKQTQEEITNKWFSQAIFAKAVEEGDLNEDAGDDEMQGDDSAKKPQIPEKEVKIAASVNLKKPQTPKDENDFEIVPTAATDSSSDSSSDDSEDDNVERKAEILACAKNMLRKKQREQILDDAYNKYMFHDEGLPSWFLEEERRHRQPTKPITKEEVEAMRAQFKEINARPAKKVAEAKARKKRAAMKQLEKVRKKANTISDQADISDRSKRKMIEQLYNKATPKKPQKEYVVAKKGVKVKVGKGKVLVDPRMKKDTRALKKQGKDNKKGKGQGKGKGKGKGKNLKGQRSKGSSMKSSSAMKGKKGY